MWAPSKTQIESACKHPHRKHSPHLQPYTRIEAKTVPNVQATPNGPIAVGVHVYAVYGITFEARYDKDEVYFVASENELGQVATLPVAHQLAGDWRRELVGIYPIG